MNAELSEGFHGKDRNLQTSLRLASGIALSDGMIPESGDVERMTALLGRPLRSYRNFASEVAGAI